MVDVRVERFIEKLCEAFPRWKSNPRKEVELVANIAIETADNCNKTLETYCDQINYAYAAERERNMSGDVDYYELPGINRNLPKREASRIIRMYNVYKSKIKNDKYLVKNIL